MLRWREIWKVTPLMVRDHNIQQSILPHSLSLSLSLISLSLSCVYAGYEVHWEERTTAVSCLHTLTEESLNYEVLARGIWNVLYTHTWSIVHAAHTKCTYTYTCTHMHAVSMHWTSMELQWIGVGCFVSSSPLMHHIHTNDPRKACFVCLLVCGFHT